jgi:hypothetical protein
MISPVQGDKRTADEVCTPALFWVMRGSGGTTRQMSVTQLCFKLNPKEHLGYFWTLRLPRSRNAPKQLLKPNILPQIPEQSITLS